MDNKIGNRLQWGIPILFGMFVPFFTYYVNSRSHPEQQHVPLWIIIIWILFAILVLSAIFYGSIEKVWLNLTYRFQKIYSSFIYELVNVRMEYLTEDGSLFSYSRHDHVTKLSLRKTNDILHIPFETEGEIVRSEISTINCSAALTSKNSMVIHCLFDEKNRIGRNHFASFAFCIKNGFTEDGQYWIIKSERYCNRYCIELIIPKARRLADLAIYHCQKEVTKGDRKILLDKDKEWQLVSDSKHMIWNTQIATVVSIVLTGITPTSMYKVAWKLDALSAPSTK